MKFSKEYEAELLARAGEPATLASESKLIAGRESPPMPHPLINTTKDAIIHEWTFRIPNWAPSPVNKLYDHHWASRRKHKKTDADVVAHYGRGVPKANQKRAVYLHVVFPPKKRMPDVDAYAKSLLDSLVHAGLLVNDSSAWCRLEPVAYSRGNALVSFVTVEDV